MLQIHLIFKAYKTWTSKRKKDEPLLPGFNYTHEQVFFISTAQVGIFYQ